MSAAVRTPRGDIDGGSGGPRRSRKRFTAVAFVRFRAGARKNSRKRFRLRSKRYDYVIFAINDIANNTGKPKLTFDSWDWKVTGARRIQKYAISNGKRPYVDTRIENTSRKRRHKSRSARSSPSSDLLVRVENRPVNT